MFLIGCQLHAQVIAKYYSGGSRESASEPSEGQREEEGDVFYRKIVQRLAVQLRPSLVVTWWDVLPGGDTEECYVILDIRWVGLGQVGGGQGR